MVIPPKVEGQYVSREDKHVSMVYGLPTPPYTGPLLYGLMEKKLQNVELSLIEAQRDDLNFDQALAELDELKPDLVICLIGWVSIPWDRVMAETRYTTIAIILQQWIDQLEAVKLYKLKSRYTLYKEIEAPLISGIKEFQEKGYIEKTKGIITEHNGNYSLTGMPEIFDLNDLSLPNYKVFKLEEYFKIREKILPYEKAHSIILNTMKSCPFNCSFCGQSNKGTKVRYQNPDFILDQIRYLNEIYKISDFAFCCNVFTVNKRRAYEFAEKLIDSGLKIKYTVNDRFGNYSKELAGLLVKSGCYEVRVGIETIDPKLQKYLNKPIDIGMAMSQAIIIKEAGLNLFLYTTPGIPGETRKSLDMTAQFISDVGADGFTTGPLFIMPGSPLYKRLVREGKILTYEWSEYRKGEKLTYINETYKDIFQIRSAETYLKEKVAELNINKKNGLLCC